MMVLFRCLPDSPLTAEVIDHAYSSVVRVRSFHITPLNSVLVWEGSPAYRNGCSAGSATSAAANAAQARNGKASVLHDSVDERKRR